MKKALARGKRQSDPADFKNGDYISDGADSYRARWGKPQHYLKASKMGRILSIICRSLLVIVFNVGIVVFGTGFVLIIGSSDISIFMTGMFMLFAALMCAYCIYMTTEALTYLRWMVRHFYAQRLTR